MKRDRDKGNTHILAGPWKMTLPFRLRSLCTHPILVWSTCVYRSPLCEVQHGVKAGKHQYSNLSQSEKPELDQEKQTISDEHVPLQCDTFIIMAGSSAALFSPLSSICRPSNPWQAAWMFLSLINLTITTYFVRTSPFDERQGTADYSTIQELKKRLNPIWALLIATQK